MVKIISLSPSNLFDEIVIKPVQKTFDTLDPSTNPEYTTKDLDVFLRSKVKNKENYIHWNYITNLPLENNEYMCIWGYTDGNIENAHVTPYNINKKVYRFYGDIVFVTFNGGNSQPFIPILRNVVDTKLENVQNVLFKLTKKENNTEQPPVVVSEPIVKKTAQPPAKKKVTIEEKPENEFLKSEKEKKKKTVCDEDEEEFENDFSDDEGEDDDMAEEDILPDEENDVEDNDTGMLMDNMEEEDNTEILKDELELGFEEYLYPPELQPQKRKDLMLNFYH